jgi:predicted negative regulator of RcsB-dependent stress response
MGEPQSDVVKFYKRNIEPFVAVFILAFLITACFLLYQDNQLKKEISTSCGWETEDYKCYCDKAFVDGIQIKLKQSDVYLDIQNVPVDR